MSIYTSPDGHTVYEEKDGKKTRISPKGILEPIKLDMDFSKYLPPHADYSVHKGSCISYQTREQKDTREDYGNGFEPYVEDNTIIQQIWHDPKDFKEIGEKLGIDIVTVSSILQPPGNTITMHRDTFFKIKKDHSDDKRTLVRANIFMEAWEPGHLIQYEDIFSPKKARNDRWKTADHWKAGEGYLWDSKVLHLSTNAGLKDKYTMQISGFYTKEI